MEKNSNSLGIVAILSLVTIALGGLLVLVVIYGDDNDLTRIIGYLTAAVPVIIGFGFVASKQDESKAEQARAAEQVSDLKGNLNGKLDQRFSDLEARLSAKVDEALGYNAPAHDDTTHQFAEEDIENV